ncbi:hypothetical protein [Thalassomonas haliotis]|uniref:Uncharacterized protein n=1 Tax=Thalassomonas haliotis TaxID=485448 RepID=A0ABY7V9I3_9GAMM|nr:hypothetical protein [Thalassomonas haliotis]WDE09880.1 hypothetical protein H3N35_16325 [Thalassomonas haliotis]
MKLPALQAGDTSGEPLRLKKRLATGCRAKEHKIRLRQRHSSRFDKPLSRGY